LIGGSRRFAIYVLERPLLRNRRLTGNTWRTLAQPGENEANRPECEGNADVFPAFHS
jgi:hypothetical protein